MMFKHRRSEEVEEGESYYISMTDMMVGVVFIFIIMLSYFALQFNSSTAALTSAKDPQTAALLQVATNLQSQQVTLEIDRDKKVVCLPGAALNEGDTERHCFAYSGMPELADTPETRKAEIATADRAAMMSAIGTELDQQSVAASVDVANGSLTFRADQLFDGDTAALSPQGLEAINKVALALAERLPCYTDNPPSGARCQDTTKMAVVNITANASFDAFTEEGRRASALALQRSVAFHEALTNREPVLKNLKAAGGTQALLRVASYGQSDQQASTNTGGQTISVQFQMAQ